MTERSTQLKDGFQQYTFEARASATKGQIRQAVQELFKVKVRSVRTMVYRGKYRKLGRYGAYRPDWKKAIVTIGVDQKIDLMEETA